MKRNIKDKQNTVDGTDFKKIKKLCFMLNNEEEDEMLQPTKISKTSAALNLSETDSESEEEEDMHSNLEDEEELNDEHREVLNKFNTAIIAKNIVAGFDNARNEVASNMDIEDELNLDNVEGLPEHFSDIRKLLATYRPNRIFPKTVKVLPQVENWNFIFDELDFESWSPAAVKTISHQFRARGGNDATEFYKNYLLPYVRDNIKKNKRLDNVLFKALEESLFRRKEFMKGILLPWCVDNIEGKDAEVLSNVIKNTKVISDAGLTAMMWLTKMDYSKGRLSVLHSFLEKKYKMKTVVISALADYFHKSTIEDFSVHFTANGEMPLAWFQSLNLFVSLNYMDLSDEDLSKLLKTCRVHKHAKVTPAILAYLKMRSASPAMEVHNPPDTDSDKDNGTRPHSLNENFTS